MFKWPLESPYEVKWPIKGEYTEKRVEDRILGRLESEMKKGYLATRKDNRQKGKNFQIQEKYIREFQEESGLQWQTMPRDWKESTGVFKRRTLRDAREEESRERISNPWPTVAGVQLRGKGKVEAAGAEGCSLGRHSVTASGVSTTSLLEPVMAKGILQTRLS